MYRSNVIYVAGTGVGLLALPRQSASASVLRDKYLGFAVRKSQTGALKA
jgi:hypothetical protein